jgi:hypothetical protein
MSQGDGGLLYSWSTHRVGAYLHALELALPRIDEGGALASVMEHCSYCGLSLARVGGAYQILLATSWKILLATSQDILLTTS